MHGNPMTGKVVSTKPPPMNLGKHFVAKIVPILPLRIKALKEKEKNPDKVYPPVKVNIIKMDDLYSLMNKKDALEKDFMIEDYMDTQTTSQESSKPILRFHGVNFTTSKGRSQLNKIKMSMDNNA